MAAAFKQQKQMDEYFNLYEKYKNKYGKVALLYELGSFYEIFGIDNEKEKIGNITELARDANLTVSRHNKKIKNNCRTNPMKAGFPSVSLDNFVKKLVDANYTVIVYSQKRQPDSKIERVLEKIVSPGTIINEETKDDAINTMCIYATGKETNISVIDLTTGKTSLYHITEQENVSKVIYAIEPKEIITNVDIKVNDKQIVHDVNIKKEYSKVSYQNELLKKVYPKHGDLTPIEYINLEYYPNMVISFIILLQFAYEHDENLIEHIQKPSFHEMSNNLFVSADTFQQLNVVSGESKSLFDIIDKTSTPMGKRLLKQRILSPSISSELLNKRYNQIESVKDYKEPVSILKNIQDIERLHRRMALGRMMPSEFCSLDSSYEAIMSLIQKNIIPLKKNTVERFFNYIEFYRNYLDLDEISKYGLNNIETPIFKQGLYAEIDELYYTKKKAWKDLNDYRSNLCKLLEEDTIKIDKTATEGYFLKITKKRFKRLEAKTSEHFRTKAQTTDLKLFNDTISTYSEIILDCNLELVKKNRDMFLRLCQDIIAKYGNLLKTINNYVAMVDVIVSGKVCKELFNYCKPVIEDKDYSFIEATDMRHAILERISDEEFISNDVHIDRQGIILYGVNGTGKSIYLKSIGLCVLMAQAGMYVPCSNFKFSLFSNLLTKISMNDNLYKGYSTFTKEMLDLRDMLNRGNSKTIILADELCCGTETKSAISIVATAIEVLNANKANFVFTTHLHELKQIISNVIFKHISIDIINEKIIYNRKIQDGSGSENYGIEIAKNLNVGNDIFIRRAFELRRKLLDKNDELLSTKTSRYNKNVYMDSCEKCGSTKNLHTHHLKHQASADENGMINGIHKNIKSNLKVLCKDCHNAEHDI